MNLNKLFAAQDMTEGSPWKRITQFAVPMLFGNIAQQLYSTVDTIVVGKYVGDLALSAVGSSGPVLNLMLALFIGISTGAGIVVSQYFGAKDRENLAKAIGNCLSLTAIATLAIMLVGPVIIKPMLHLLKTPESIIEWAANYLLIFFIGAAGFTFYNILSGILRGMGDSLSALAILLVCTVLNIGLDIWFVAGLKMGVPGVSLATVISQLISAVLCFVKLLHMKGIFTLHKSDFLLTGFHAARIIKLGVPSGITQAIFSMSMLVSQSLTNSLGEMVIACNVIVMRVDGFAMMPNMTFGNSMSVYSGQNVGAGKLDRIQKGALQGLVLAVVTSAVITLGLLVFGRNLMYLFTETEELIELSVRMLRILAVGYIAVAGSQVFGGVIRGAGDTVTPMWIGLFTTVGLRLPLAYLMVGMTKSPDFPNGKPEALFGSMLISWVIGMVLNFLAFRFGPWKKRLFQMKTQ